MGIHLQMDIFNFKDRVTEPRKGDLLISEPFLADQNFSRTVILLCDHNEEGSLGFVLNKPANFNLNDVTDEEGLFEKELFIGGPVQQDTLHFIYRSPMVLEGSIEVKEGLYWGGNFEQLLTLAKDQEIRSEDFKFFVGYSGWASGQLMDELNVNSWIISRNIKTEQIFNTDIKSLWKEVLNAMGGKFKVISNFPVDPRLN